MFVSIDKQITNRQEHQTRTDDTRGHILRNNTNANQREE
jgi:hypothetical protein